MPKRWVFSTTLVTMSGLCGLTLSSQFTAITRAGDEGLHEAFSISKATPLDSLDVKSKNIQPVSEGMSASPHESHGVHMLPTDRDQFQKAVRKARLPNSDVVENPRVVHRAKPAQISFNGDKKFLDGATSDWMRNLKEFDYLYPWKVQKFVARLNRHRELVVKMRWMEKYLYTFGFFSYRVSWEKRAKWLIEVREALINSGTMFSSRTWI